ncbi:MAG: DUF58 domain-containing protein [Lachnospiraceae bacterium]|nr:DUF58 domain-containing protein [Lachnospiraceae bacterium]
MLRNRLIAVGLFILSLIAISFYGGPVSYGFFFLMLLIPAISLIYTIVVYFRFRIYQKIITKNVVVGTPTDFYFTLQNEDFYSFSGVKVEFFSNFSYISELTDNSEYELAPHSGLKKETVLVCKYRGEYDVGIRNVIIQDYLRLFRINFPNKERLRAIVSPRLEILDSLSHSYSPIVFKDSAVNPTEQDVLVREYIPGDDIRNINWKMSAHLGKPFLRTKTGSETPGIGIIMDSCRYSNEPAEFLPLENKILETVIALSHYYLKNGITVSVQTYENIPGKYLLQNIDSFEDFYASMSSFIFSFESTSAKLFESVWHSNVSSNSLVYLVLHEISDEAKFQMEELNKNGIPVVICHITEENAEGKIDLGKNTEYIKIGYEDKLKEVL